MSQTFAIDLLLKVLGSFSEIVIRMLLKSEEAWRCSFTVALYMRTDIIWIPVRVVEVLNVPATLLGQIDA